MLIISLAKVKKLLICILLVLFWIVKMQAQTDPFLIYTVPDTIIAGTPVILSTNLNLVAGNEIIISKNDAVADIQNASNPRYYPVGFNFSFFGDTYSDFSVGSNGYLTFQKPPWKQHLPFLLPPGNPPQQMAPKNCILGPIKNYDYETNPGVYAFYKTLGTTPNQKLVVYWCDVPVMGSKDKATFQIVLNEDGSIENHLIFLPYSDYAGNRATQGIVDKTGTISFPDPNQRNNSSWITNAGLRGNSWKYTINGTGYNVDLNYSHQPVLLPSYIIWYEVGSDKPIGYETTLMVWPKKTTTYRAEIFTCWNEKIGESSVTVTVKELTPKYFFPGTGSTFGLDVPTGVEVGPFTLQVFNRWGQRVFQTSDAAIRWNGRMNNSGQYCPTGIYPWVLIIQVGNNPISNRGFVSLVR